MTASITNSYDPCRDDLETARRKFRGSVVYSGDIVNPVDEEWEAGR